MWNHYEFIYFGGPRIINLQRLELFSGLHSASFKELYQTFKVSSCDYTISKSGDNNITWGPQTLDFENTRFFYILRMCCTAIAPFRSSPRLAVACWLSCCDPPPRAPPPSPRPGSRCPWRPPGRRRTNRCWCWSRCTLRRHLSEIISPSLVTSSSCPPCPRRRGPAVSTPGPEPRPPLTLSPRGWEPELQHWSHGRGLHQTSPNQFLSGGPGQAEEWMSSFLFSVVALPLPLP